MPPRRRSCWPSNRSCEQDAVLSRFRNSPGSRLFDFEEATEIAVAHQDPLLPFDGVLDPDYVEMCYAHQQSADDLTLMLEECPRCREIGDSFACSSLSTPPLEGELRNTDLHSIPFPDLHRFPPIWLQMEFEYPSTTLKTTSANSPTA
ncbi:hypothetical protein BS47DRAFT_1401732 [Hydnum rufescens UP504]|uniref:Uncharacterized protein n=1 Tax=Hydnum rufescens UP504 TaxID=1448309 RepID=A0A9P6AF95_9AGAM|nr:hypothetical protein BS47DRAFT_1401732 [Hydnum rufescens UP504]